MSRKYELKRRAEKQAETRRRIVDATVSLHTTEGPARTTISAIADRAGVERHTVYAHFPDERSLFDACTTHWAALHPFPDPERWRAVVDPDTRLRTALRAMYDWYESVEWDLAVFERDAKVHEATAEAVARRKARTVALRNELARGWPRRKPVLAALGHALEFETWRSLVRDQGLTQKQAVEAMSSFVASV
jgi:AcrR family transcriptional regulator